MLARAESTRSKSPRAVAQELCRLAIAYDLVRLEAERVAAEARVPPTRVSFVAALTFLENALPTWAPSAGAAPRTPGQSCGQTSSTSSSPSAGTEVTRAP